MAPSSTYSSSARSRVSGTPYAIDRANPRSWHAELRRVSPELFFLFRGDGGVALVDPLPQQIGGDVVLLLEVRRDPAALAQAVAGGLRPGEHGDRRLGGVGQLAGEPEPAVGLAHEDEGLLADLV